MERKKGSCDIINMASLRRLSVELTKFPNVKLLEVEPLNRRQCKNLLDNFENGVQAIQKIYSGFQEDVFDGAEKDMLCIMKKSRSVVEECCEEDWCQVVMMQINNKELFRELLWDFECSFHLMCDIFRHSLPGREDEINAVQRSATFYPASIDEVEEDQNAICERLSKHLKLCKVAECKDCRLTNYLLGRVRGLQKAEGGELDSIVFPSEYPWPIYENPSTLLNASRIASVYRTQWLGFDTMTKTIPMTGPHYDEVVWNEASILGGLSHPNIIKFLCCGLRTTCDKFGNDQRIFELVMEQGGMSLSQILEHQDLLTEEDAIELMLQIARGICYLHDMKVAHRDLKPTNVVVTSKAISKARNLGDVHVKLVDFGLSKFVYSPTMLGDGDYYGTTGYMAPEVFLERRLGIDPFKADVFSFGMMCSEILTTKKNYGGIMFRDYKNSILNGKRPKLPKTCSNKLKSLIHECWSLDPSKRPTFLDICQRLTKLKSEAIVKAFLTSHVDSNTNQRQWWTTLKFWKFLGSLWFLSVLWQMFAGFNRQLSRILPKILGPSSVTSLPSNREVSNTIKSNPMSCEVSNVFFKSMFLPQNYLYENKSHP
jgi:serine/threonine protein kinase